MSTYNNLVSGSKFIDITAINSGGNKSICCEFCVGDAIVTHLVYRLHRDDSFSLSYGCSGCTTGWREIADQKNDRVV